MKISFENLYVDIWTSGLKGLRIDKETGARFSKVPLTLRARNQIFKSK